MHSLKYKRFTALDCKDIGIKKSELVAKIQSFWKMKLWNSVVLQDLNTVPEFLRLNGVTGKV